MTQIATTNPIHGAMFMPSNYVGTRGTKGPIKKFSEYFKKVPGYKELVEDEKKKKKKEGKNYQEPMRSRISMYGYRILPTIRYKHMGAGGGTAN